MTSSVNQLLQALSEQLSGNSNNNDRSRFARASNSNWNAEKIAENLGIKISGAPEIEASFLFPVFGGRRIVAFGKDTINNLPQMFQEALSKAQQQNRFDFTAFYSQNEIQLGFPTSMGLPFVYSLTVPTMAHLQGEVKLHAQSPSNNYNRNHINIPQHVNISFEVDAAYTSQSDSKFGIVAPFNSHEYFTGVLKNLEASASFESSLAVDTETKKVDIRLSPSSKNRKQVVFAYGTVPYTTKYDILNIKPALEQSGTNRIHVDEQTKAQFKFGSRTTGLAFEYEAMTESLDDDFQLVNPSASNFFHGISSVPFPFVQRGLHPHYAALTYDPQQSSAEAVQFSFTYKNKYTGADKSQQHSNEASYKDAIPLSYEPQDRSRSEQFLKRVSEGVNDGRAHVFDLGVQFENSKRSNSKYVATVSYASSYVSSQSNILLYLGANQQRNDQQSEGSYEVCASAKSQFFRVPKIDLFDSLRANPNSSFYSSFAFGRNCNSGTHLNTKVLLAQSEDYRQNLKDDDMVKECKRLMHEGDALSYACQNATRKANTVDFLKFYFKYENQQSKQNGDLSNPAEESSVLPISVWLNKFGADYEYASGDSQRHQLPRNEFEVATQFSPDYDYINITLLHDNQVTEYRRVYLDAGQFKPYYIVQWLVNSARLDKEENLNYPFCALDSKYINTFDNATYPAKLNNDWHAVFLYTPQQSSRNPNRENQVVYDKKQENIAIIAKDSPQGKVIEMLLGEHGVEIHPTGSSGARFSRSSDSQGSRGPAARVSVNGRPMTFSAEESVSVQSPDGDIVRIYAQPNGEVTVHSPAYGLNIKYYAENVMIYAAGHYKNNIRGLCGTYNGNKYTDFTSPRNCILSDPEKFTASYILVDSNTSQSGKQKKEAANKEACYKDEPFSGNLISDYEAGRNQPNKRSNRNKATSSNGSSKNRLSNRVIKHDSHTCISLHAYPECSSNQSCKKIQAPFYCQDSSSSYMNKMRQEIEQGHHPDLGDKQENKWFQIEVPKSKKDQ